MREPLVQSAPLLTRINVTPIIDVALVLVIILLITAPMLSVADLGVDLPQTRSRDLDHQGHVSVTVAADGKLAVDDRVVADVSDLTELLRGRLAHTGAEPVPVVVRADASLTHAAVGRVLSAVRAAGAVRLGVGTRRMEVALP